MNNENKILSTCGEFNQGLRDKPCCSSCPACKCHVISKIKEDFPGLPEKMQQIDSTEN